MANKFVLNQEDGTVEGGNVRGVGAVDLQMSRGGSTDVAGGDYSVIVGGKNNEANGDESVAIGSGNRCNSNNSYALGVSNNSSGGDSIAIGIGCAAGGYSSIAMGRESSASSNRSIAIGNNCVSSADRSVAIGLTNTASSARSVVSGGESNTASTNTHTTVVGGYQNSSTGQYSISGGYSNVASNIGSVALGYDNTASGVRSVAMGNGCTASGSYSFAMGDGSQSTGQSSIAFSQGDAIGYGSVAIGGYPSSPLKVFDNFAVGFGTDNYVYGRGALCFGNGVQTNYRGSLGFASGKFSTRGDAQQSYLTSRKEDTLTTGATTTLSLDGTGTTNLIIPDGNNRVWNVTVETQAVVTNTNGTSGIAAGDVYSEVSKLTFKKIGGVSSLVGIISRQFVFDGGMGTAQMNYSAGASQELAIEFQAPAFGAGDITVRVVSKVSLVEVAY